ncbi:MAG: amidohydrolase family protein [Albidovulum sp.]|nr:amidohydrolase family protein [Albidovulum sp.]
MKLDSHQHFWRYAANPGDFPWMTDDLAALRRDFLPEDLAPLREDLAVDGTIAVQAREMEVETDFLLGLARDDKSIKGIVGWVDLCAKDVEARLDRFAGNPAFRGVRMLIHDRADLDFADSAPHLRGVSCLESRGLTYDLLLRTAHIEAAIRLVDKLPHQRFVVDHIAKPKMDGIDRDEWETGIRSIAERPNVFCKLSGLVTEANWSNWKPESFGPYLDTVLEAFGAGRLMVGSDWPVCTLATSYAGAIGLVAEWSRKLSDDERADVMGKNCARFYSV